MSKNVLIHQIFYNDKTKSLIDTNFISLDNTLNERPDWYEFWVIRNFLLNNDINENSWYGFFSTKFFIKTGLNSNQLINFIEKYGINKDVILIGNAWDQIAYFQNQYIQGEFYHPGILNLSQKVFDNMKIEINLNNMVSHSLSSQYSNFIIAKKKYWTKWLELANIFFELSENNNDNLSKEINKNTSYGSKTNMAPIKTFIQERFPSVLLNLNNFNILNTNLDKTYPINSKLFKINNNTRDLLLECDKLKIKYVQSKENIYLLMYKKIQKTIELNQFLN